VSTVISLNASNGIATLTNATKNYNLVAMPASTDGKTVSTIRLNPAAALGSPERLLISHQNVPAKAGGVGVDRHVVRVDLTKPPSGDTPAVTCSVYFNAIVPQAGFTMTEVKDQVGILVDLLNDLALLTRLLNNDPIAE
jgi:hypothetical protein